MFSGATDVVVVLRRAGHVTAAQTPGGVIRYRLCGHNQMTCGEAAVP